MKKIVSVLLSAACFLQSATAPTVHALEAGQEYYGYVLLSQDQVADYLKDLGDYQCTEETLFFCNAGLYDPFNKFTFCFLSYDTSMFMVTIETLPEAGEEQTAEIMELLNTQFDDSYTIRSSIEKRVSTYRYHIKVYDGEHRDVTRDISIQTANILLSKYDNIVSCNFQPFCQNAHNYWWNYSITTYDTADYPNAAEEISALLITENEPWNVSVEGMYVHVQPNLGAELTTEYIRINKLIYDKLGYEAFYMITGFVSDGWGYTNYLEQNGDVDRNGTVDTVDSIIALQEYNRVSVMGENPTLTLTQNIAADLDGNGVITTVDAVEILKIYNANLTA